MRVRGTALMHFVFEHAGPLEDDEVRQAMVDRVGSQVIAYEDVRITIDALAVEDVTVDRGVDA